MSTIMSGIAEMSMADAVTAESPAYRTWMADSLLPRTLLEGTSGMRLAGNVFLNKHPLESALAFQERIKNSTLLNAYAKTNSFLAGQVFQERITFEHELPSIFEQWFKDIDREGNSLDIFARRVFFNGNAKGVSHILPDTPVKAEETTVADDAAKGIQPYFKEVRPEDVIGWIVDENNTLIQVRILEYKTVRVGQFGSKVVASIRVLEPGTWKVYNLDSDDAWTLDDEGIYPFNYIPLFTYIPGINSTLLTGRTPLMDLADLNSHHWRSSSDQNNILHVGRVPILFGRNVQLSQMPVGVATMVTSEDDGADMKYVEIQGQAIAAGANDLKETEAQMALYGLQQLIPRTGNQTATEKAITSAESNSSLSSWATDFEDVLQAALACLGDLGGTPFPEDNVRLNKEFNLGVADPQVLAMILQAKNDNIISAQAAFTEFRRRGTFDAQLGWEDMEDDMEKEKQEAMNLAMMAGSVFGKAEGETEGDDDE